MLIAPRWIDDIGWVDEKVYVALSRESVEKAPEYKEDEVITRDYETHLYQYYDKESYWVNEPVKQ